MINPQTIADIKLEMHKIDRHIAECSDENGVVEPWNERRVNKLAELKTSFKLCIEYLEGHGVGVTV